jgi:hypothetical protein
MGATFALPTIANIVGLLLEECLAGTAVIRREGSVGATRLLPHLALHNPTMLVMLDQWSSA